MASGDRALKVGQAPRSVVRRYAGLNKKAFQKHRDGCLSAAADASCKVGDSAEA
jgi:hypothetical protein